MKHIKKISVSKPASAVTGILNKIEDILSNLKGEQSA